MPRNEKTRNVVLILLETEEEKEYEYIQRVILDKTLTHGLTDGPCLAKDLVRN